MHRSIAYLQIQNFSIQVVLKKQPDWRRSPIAILDEHGYSGRIVDLNSLALKRSLKLGMKFSLARDIVPDLHATTANENHETELIEDISKGLRAFSPNIEVGEKGSWLLDPSGMSELYVDILTWARSIQQYLRGRRWVSTLTIGFNRHRLEALSSMCPAKASHSSITHSIVIYRCPDDEKKQTGEVDLDALQITPFLREMLSDLQIYTVNDLLKLPADEIQSHLGSEAKLLYERFSDNSPLPLQPTHEQDEVGVSLGVEPPDDDLARLLFGIKTGLHDLLGQIRNRYRALMTLHCVFHLEHGGTHEERIEPSNTTRDEQFLLELVRLRLYNAMLSDRISLIHLSATLGAYSMEQNVFITEKTAVRNATSAKHTLAQLRAAFGNESVSKAYIRDGHLPEARFKWIHFDSFLKCSSEMDRREHSEAFTVDKPYQPLVRRLLNKPQLLASQDPTKPAKGPELPDETIVHLYGPYRIHGGWWNRMIERDYYYAETTTRAIHWIFFDAQRNNWFLHGHLD